jgi:hypothetical protein
VADRAEVADLAPAGDRRLRISVRRPSMMFVRTAAGDLIAIYDIARFTAVEHPSGGCSVFAVLRIDGTRIELARHLTLEVLEHALSVRR